MTFINYKVVSFLLVIALAQAVSAFSIDKMYFQKSNCIELGQQVSVHFDTSITSSQTDQQKVKFALTTASPKQLKNGLGDDTFGEMDISKVNKGQGTMQLGFDLLVDIPAKPVVKQRKNQQVRLAAEFQGTAGVSNSPYVIRKWTKVEVKNQCPRNV